MKVNVVMGGTKKTMDRILNRGVGIFTAETCARYFEPYVPYDKGNLSQTYTTEPNKITYEMTYAHRLYNGKGFKFSDLQHAQATSEWDKASMTVNKGKIAKEITQYIKRG